MMIKIKLAAIVVFLILVTAALQYSRGGFLVSKESMNTPKNLIAVAALPPLPVEGKAPALTGIVDWINSKPLLADDIRGKVVLIDFWTYSCINCIRTLPHLSEWYRKYRDSGFVVLGVHSPEFKFEKKKENVEAAIKKYGLGYPIALDSDHATWNAFGNQYWPAHYLVDVNGNIRYHSFGEGHYAQTESAIQNLLREAGLLTLDKITEIKEPPSDADLRSIGTPEIYLGYLRINNVGNSDTDVRPDAPHTFARPEGITENRFYFVGTWAIGPESAELSEGGGKLLLRYKANKVNIVAEAKGSKEIILEILLDERPIGRVAVSSPQLHNLIDSGGGDGWHTLEIRIPTPGFRAFTFTFG